MNTHKYVERRQYVLMSRVEMVSYTFPLCLSDVLFPLVHPSLANDEIF